ncbi:MAG: hypothetical protein ACPGTP_01230 [Bacteroidia bacterium]
MKYILTFLFITVITYSCTSDKSAENSIEEINESEEVDLATEKEELESVEEMLKRDKERLDSLQKALESISE